MMALKRYACFSYYRSEVYLPITLRYQTLKEDCRSKITSEMTEDANPEAEKSNASDLSRAHVLLVCLERAN